MWIEIGRKIVEKFIIIVYMLHKHIKKFYGGNLGNFFAPIFFVFISKWKIHFPETAVSKLNVRKALRYGATTLGITTLSKMLYSITTLSIIIPSIMTLSITVKVLQFCHYDECYYVKCHYNKCHYNKCHYDELYNDECHYEERHYDE